MAVFRYPQTQTTITGVATEAKQDVMITELQDINTELDTINTNTADNATETTLTALNAKVTAVDTTGKATEAKQDDIITQVTTTATNTADNATETTLATVKTDTASIVTNTAEFVATGVSIINRSLTVTTTGGSSVTFNDTFAADPCGTGTGELDTGALYFTTGGHFCYCDDTGTSVDLLVSSDGACTY